MIPHMYKLVHRVAVPIDDPIEWGKWFETADRQVALTEIGDLTVSTVFLGIDHNFLERFKHELFETMVFGEPEPMMMFGKKYILPLCQDDMPMRRYPTWEAAEKGHKRICAFVYRKLASVERKVQQSLTTISKKSRNKKSSC